MNAINLLSAAAAALDGLKFLASAHKNWNDGMVEKCNQDVEDAADSFVCAWSILSSGSTSQKRLFDDE